MTNLAVSEPKAVIEDRESSVPALMPRDMDAAIRLAQMMAKAQLVPVHLHDKPADCLMIIEQAARWRMSPFAVAQAASSVKGRLMFEGKLIAAAINTSGILSGRLDYDFEGEGAKRAVIVSGTIRGESKLRSVRVTLAESATDNGCWKKQPDQQLVYTGARVWARRHTPEIMLGVYSPDEEFIDDVPPATAAVSLMPAAKAETKPDDSGNAETRPVPKPEPEPAKKPAVLATAGALNLIRAKAKAAGIDEAALLAHFQIHALEGIDTNQVNEILGWIKTGGAQ